jgi:WD40 repeat protein
MSIGSCRVHAIGVLCFTLMTGIALAKSPRAKADASDPPELRPPLRLGSTHLRRVGVGPLALFPDNKVLLAGDNTGMLYFWDATTGKELRRLPAVQGAGQFSSAYMHMALSPNAKMVACLVPGRDLHLVDLETGKALPGPRNMHFDPGPVFSPDGKVVYGAEGGLLLGLELATGKEALRAKLPLILRCLACSPDGKLLAVGGRDRTVRVVEAATGKELHSLRGHRGVVFAVAFSPDGNLLASAGGDDALILWDMTTGKELRRCLAQQQGLTTVTFTRDGRFLAVGGNDGVVHIWHAASGKLVRQCIGHGTQRSWDMNVGTIHSVVFAADDQTLYTAGLDGTIRVWNTALKDLAGDPNKWETTAAKEKLPHNGHVGEVREIAFTPDSRTVLTTGSDFQLRRWDAATGKELAARLISTDKRVADRGLEPVFLPDGRNVLLRGNDGTLELADVKTGEVVYRGTSPLPFAGEAAISPSGRTLALASARDHRIFLYDVATLTERRRLVGHRDGVRQIAFAAGGSILVSSGDDGTTRTWNVADGTEIQEIGQRLVAVSPDGHTLVCRGENGGYALFDGLSGELRLEITHWRNVAGIAFSPDGWYFALTSERTITVYETGSGEEVARRPIDSRYVSQLRFSPDSRTLAWSEQGGLVFVWNLAGGRSGAGQPPVELSPPELEKRWQALAGNDASANGALWSLVASPQEAVPLLSERLRPATSATEEQVRRWVRQLGGDDLEWKQAEAELEQLDADGARTFRKVVAGTPLGKARTEGERLLQHRRGVVQTPALRRKLRALHALEQIAHRSDTKGEAEVARNAAAVIERLAGGSDGAPLTLAAREARRRLGKQEDLAVVTPAVPPPEVARPLVPPGSIAVRLGKRQFEDDERVSSVAFSPDGKLLALAVPGSVRLWDSGTGKELRRWSAPTHAGTTLAFSPDGEVLAAGCSDKAVHRWDIASGKELASLRGHAEQVSGIAFTADGKRLASGSGDRICLWDARKGELLRHCAGHGPGTVAVAFSADGKYLASCGGNGKVCIWNSETLEQLRELAGARGNRWIAFTPDGGRLMALAADGGLTSWDWAEGAEELPRIPEVVSAWAMSPDGSRLALGVGTGELTVIDRRRSSSRRLREGSPGWSARYSMLPNGKNLSFVEGDVFPVETVTFSADGKRVAAAARDHTLRVWDTETGKQLLPRDDGHAPVLSVAFTAGGKHLLAIGTDHSVTTWDVLASKEVHRHQFPPLVSRNMNFSSDGRNWLVTDHQGKPYLRITTAGEETERPIAFNDATRGGAWSIGLSADGKVVATVVVGRRGMRELCLWDAATGKLLQTAPIVSQRFMPRTFTFSPDGNVVAVSDGDQVELIDARTGRLIAQLLGRRSGHGGGGAPPLFSADGRSIHAAYSTHAGTFLCQWEVATGSFRGPVITWPDRHVTALALSPDERTLVCATTKENAIHVWDAVTGAHLGQLAGHHSTVRCLAFSPDGSSLASGSDDTTIVVWKLAARPPLPAVTPTPRELERLWDELGGGNAGKAFGANQRLQQSGDAATAALAKHLHPAPGPDRRRVAALVADLGNDTFITREHASAELAKGGEGIRRILREEKAKQSNPEVLRRIDEVLATPLPPLVPLTRLQEIRALEVLEHVATPAARRVLEELAAGAIDDPVTQAAAASRDRLARKAVSGK